MEPKFCPVCHKEMIPNHDGKAQNPKAPDWKCSDGNCKMTFNRSTNQWEPGKFVTSVWNERPKSSPKAPWSGEQNQRSQDIAKAQANKESSMRLFSSGRDAVLIVTTLYPELSQSMEKDVVIKNKIKEWQKYLYDTIYADTPFL